jgi:hypothetical protein
MGGARENAGIGDRLATIRQHIMNLETQSDGPVQ